jgi:aminomethyltransferase
MKRTAFYNIHKQLGAKIVEFAGFEMPIQYTSILEEHRCVRKSVGMFDVSHMGEIEVWGKDAAAFVQKTTVNDVTRLSPGKVQYSAMCYDDGGIVDDLLVYQLGDHFMLVVNASNIAKDFAWLQQHAFGDVKLFDTSDEISLLAVQGPQSISALQKLTDIDLGNIPYYAFVRGKLAGVDMVVSRTGYTGEIGFELYFTSRVSISEQVWNAILTAGKDFGIQPVGLGARDTLRLEMGFRLYGNDIDQTTNPLEAGLGWITKLGKEDFIGRQALLRVKQEGLKRKLVGFTIEQEKAFPRHGFEIRVNGSVVGTVTSGTVSPILEKAIGMGYVAFPYCDEVGKNIHIVLRNKEATATITKVPFIQR